MNAQPDRKARQAQVRQRRSTQAKGILQGVLSQLRPGGLAVDCGAHAGRLTRALAETGADVVAFEPDPVPFAKLSAALSDRPNVTLHQAAVGISDAQAPLFRLAGFDENPLPRARRSTVVPRANLTERSDVSVEVLDLPKQIADWAERYGRVDFLKLDVEGAELDILTEMLRLRLFDKVALTVAELHGYRFPHLKREFDALRSTLNDRFPETRVWLEWV